MACSSSKVYMCYSNI